MKGNYFFLTILLCFLHGILLAQNDSIYISGVFSPQNNSLNIEQKLVYKNNLNHPIDRIKLLNWIAAYKNKGTPLADRKLEDRKNELYFAKPFQLGSLNDLEISLNQTELKFSDLNKENIYVHLGQSLNPEESVTLKLKYNIKLPDAEFTGYGYTENTASIKYFFLVPDWLEDTSQKPKYYRDIEETQSGGNYWSIKIKVPTPYKTLSNLRESADESFEGTLNNDPEFLITQDHYTTIPTVVDDQKITTTLGYPLKENEKEYLEFYLPLQLKFIKDRTGYLPEAIFISEKFREKEDFFGNNDIKVWKFEFPLFTERENTDLDYISILSKKIIESAYLTNKIEDHWLTNGIKTYLEIQYLELNYPDTKLLGMLPETAKIIGIRPLKGLNAGKLKLTDRYGIGYQYIMRQNLDQKITTPFNALSNFNEMAISNFETGSILNFVSERMQQGSFNNFLHYYLSKNINKQLDSQEFITELTNISGNSPELINYLLDNKTRINFKLQKVKKEDDNYKVWISKNTDLEIPFKTETETKDGEKESYWFNTPENKRRFAYRIPQSDAKKVTVNDDYLFPEKNLRDNYIYTTGLFSNAKKWKFKLFKDVPNPEYNEIYVMPNLQFNAYDKILLGGSFKNKSLFDQKFQYTFKPYYSTGTQQLVGSGVMSYSFQPIEQFFRELTIGGSGSYFHYDYDLAYRKFSLFSNLNFRKDPRSTVSRNVGFSYSFFDKDMAIDSDPTEYSQYNLWNFYFSYSDSKLIHEHYFNANYQTMQDFNKIALEGYYRWEYAEDKKLSFRVFAGLFLNNNTKNNTFDFGISRISNYSFSYNLLGQSATSGLLSQQFVLADAGFKSYVGDTANRWLTTTNIDGQVWKMFNIYADFGLYKNKSIPTKFIWDSGIKLRIVPDLFEIYFPVASTNGFEPSLGNYQNRIRFSLVLSFNTLTSIFRRGWF